MKLSLASNYDPDLVAKLKGYPVAEIFGKLPYDLVGGGRPSYMGTPFSYRQLAEYVALVQSNGMAFNYLLNSACMGNREWGRRWQKKFNKFLEKLSQAGVSRVTVATPFLLELVKKRFPHFYVKVGIFAQVDTPRRAKFWEDLGADAITLESFSINRDFAVLTGDSKSGKMRTAAYCQPPVPAELSDAILSSKRFRPQFERFEKLFSRLLFAEMCPQAVAGAIAVYQVGVDKA